MSRIAKQAVKISEGVTVTRDRDLVTIRGPKGELNLVLHPKVSLDLTQPNTLAVEVADDTKELWAIAGATRSHLVNHIHGVTEGWQKTLELVGVGYRAVVTGDELVLTIGFSHPVKIKTPKGISFEVKENKITVKGADKQLVGKVTAEIRALKKPEPYKGKGIRYQDEIIRKKAGKSAKAVGAGTTGAK